MGSSYADSGQSEHAPDSEIANVFFFLAFLCLNTIAALAQPQQIVHIS